MIFYTSPWACAIISLIIGIHALVPFVKNLFMRIAMGVNICLHLLLVLLLLLLGAQLVELVAVFMGSLLIYVSFSYFGIKKADKERRDKNEL